MTLAPVLSQQQSAKYAKAVVSNITGTANNGSGLIRVLSANHKFKTGNGVAITGVVGTVEANGNWTVTSIDASHFDLQNSAFSNAYTSGGMALRIKG